MPWIAKKQGICSFRTLWITRKIAKIKTIEKWKISWKHIDTLLLNCYLLRFDEKNCNIISLKRKIENILFDQWRHSYLNFDQQFCRDVSSFASSSIYEVIDLYLSFLTDKQASSNLPNAKSNDLLPR